jgi:hypothetical protein
MLLLNIELVVVEEFDSKGPEGSDWGEDSDRAGSKPSNMPPAPPAAMFVLPTTVDHDEEAPKEEDEGSCVSRGRRP